MLTKPRWMLHVEAVVIFGLAVYFYRSGGYRWWLFAVLFLTPDLFMLGYLKGARWGAAVYNLVHSTTLPLLLLAGSLFFAAPQGIPCALIGIAHVGIDRAMGFGLKYPTFFKDTHLQHV